MDLSFRRESEIVHEERRGSVAGSNRAMSGDVIGQPGPPPEWPWVFGARESYNLRMCFMLNAGTNEPIPRKAWNRDAPDICVLDLVGDEKRIR